MTPAGPAIFRRVDGLVLRHIAGECILVPCATTPAGFEKIFALNPLGEAIWELLAEGMTLDALIHRITERFDVDAETAGRDLREFLAEMQREGLVERRESGDAGG